MHANVQPLVTMTLTWVQSGVPFPPPPLGFQAQPPRGNFSFQYNSGNMGLHPMTFQHFPAYPQQGIQNLPMQNNVYQPNMVQAGFNQTNPSFHQQVKTFQPGSVQSNQDYSEIQPSSSQSQHPALSSFSKLAPLYTGPKPFIFGAKPTKIRVVQHTVGNAAGIFSFF